MSLQPQDRPDGSTQVLRFSGSFVQGAASAVYPKTNAEYSSDDVLPSVRSLRLLLADGTDVANELRRFIPGTFDDSQLAGVSPHAPVAGSGVLNPTDQDISERTWAQNMRIFFASTDPSVAPVPPSPSGSGLAAYGGIFALMPGNNPATLKQWAGGGAGANMSLQLPNDPAGLTGGIVGALAGGGAPPALPAVQDRLLVTVEGDYEINFQVSINEGADGAQLQVEVGGVPDPNMVAGRATGTTQIVGSFLRHIVASAIAPVSIRLINPEPNAVALTITPNAGGAVASPVSATLSAKLLTAAGGGPPPPAGPAVPMIDPTLTRVCLDVGADSGLGTDTGLPVVVLGVSGLTTLPVGLDIIVEIRHTLIR